jgi:glycosyltransferase involved in cell wall biosynthesis
MNYKYKFSVFTPTYNRANKLHRVYDSLKAQTIKDFEWLIVDDGSTDNTKSLVEKWLEEENDFPIKYIYKINGGKHTAINLGVRNASGELFLTLDSDDSCLDNSLEVFSDIYDGIKNLPEFSGITVHCIDENDQIVGDEFPKNPFDSNSIDNSLIHKITGEKWGLHRTDVMREFPFPEIENIKFIPEGIVWRQISQKYKTRYVNQRLRRYMKSEDSLTNLNPKQYAVARILDARYLFDDCFKEYFNKAPLSFIKSTINYNRSFIHKAYGKYLFSDKAKINLFIIAGFFPGLLVYFIDKWKMKFRGN